MNLLTHTKSVIRTSTKLNTTKQKDGYQDEALVYETDLQTNDDQGGALWDVFRRQDVSNLEKYLRNHSAEFCHVNRLSVEQVISNLAILDVYIC